MFKSGFVSIVGRPNVGKSTLMNNVVGEKIAIMSDKPQTTRNTIQAVYTDEEAQVVFLDTPGIHKPKNKLGEFMVKSATDAFKNVDLQMPRSSSSRSRLSPSMPSKQKLTLPGSRFTGSPLRAE